jgi:hypothetical protein
MVGEKTCILKIMISSTRLSKLLNLQPSSLKYRPRNAKTRCHFLVPLILPISLGISPKEMLFRQPIFHGTLTKVIGRTLLTCSKVRGNASHSKIILAVPTETLPDPTVPSSTCQPNWYLSVHNRS